jgi:hypothetical protein
VNKGNKVNKSGEREEPTPTLDPSPLEKGRETQRKADLKVGCYTIHTVFGEVEEFFERVSLARRFTLT